MLAKILAITGLVSTGLLLVLVTTTTPESAGALGILGVFLLTYSIIVCLLSFCVWVLGRVVDAFGPKTGPLSRKYAISLRKSYYYSSVIALGPVIVISLQSVGGVSIYELSLVIFFIALGCVYVARRSA
jgi:hypothetical protein